MILAIYTLCTGWLCNWFCFFFFNRSSNASVSILFFISRPKKNRYNLLDYTCKIIKSSLKNSNLYSLPFGFSFNNSALICTGFPMRGLAAGTLLSLAFSAF